MNGQLVEAARRRRVILFAGAGLSMRLGVPSLDGVIGFLARELGVAQDEVRAARDHTLLAGYYRLRRGHLAALRRHLAETAQGAGADVRRSAAHAAMVALGFPIIYTTRYDHWLSVPCYSQSDVNVRYLLYKLDRLWQDAGCAQACPRS